MFGRKLATFNEPEHGQRFVSLELRKVCHVSDLQPAQWGRIIMAEVD